MRNVAELFSVELRQDRWRPLCYWKSVGAA